MKKYFIVFMLMFLLVGCAAGKKSPPEMVSKENVSEVTPPMYTTPILAEGSLWSDIEGVSLYADQRARRIGDIVKVSIVEDPEAELNANTQTNRNSGVGVSQLEILGWMKAAAREYPDLAQNPGVDNLITANLSTNFSGQGSSDRDGHIKAYVPALVTNIFPNGNLLIRGKREIKVNSETQFVSVSGVIRAQDINQFNEISSSSIASAAITYSGSGPIADKQKPGWLTKVLDYVWPF
jgi:flagellar L-ring protein precursor FlgH